MARLTNITSTKKKSSTNIVEPKTSDTQPTKVTENTQTNDIHVESTMQTQEVSTKTNTEKTIRSKPHRTPKLFATRSIEMELAKAVGAAADATVEKKALRTVRNKDRLQRANAKRDARKDRQRDQLGKVKAALAARPAAARKAKASATNAAVAIDVNTKSSSDNVTTTTTDNESKSSNGKSKSSKRVRFLTT